MIKFVIFNLAANPIKMENSQIELPSVSRIANIFSIGALATIAAGLLSWLILSSTLANPTAEDVQMLYGFLDMALPWIKPEPVENRTFLLITVIGVFVFGLASLYSLKASQKKSFHNLPVVGLIACAVTWLYFMRWDTLFLTVPSALAKGVLPHQTEFLVLTTAFIASAWIITKSRSLAKYKSGIFWLVYLPAVAFISSLTIFSSKDSISIGGHFEVLVYPIIQDYLGKALFINQQSQYGMYPIFMRPLWILTGPPNPVTISSAMATALFFSNCSTLLFMNKISQHKILALSFAFATVAYPIFAADFWPHEPYFQFLPLRIMFPSLAIIIICISPQRIPSQLGAYLALAFGLFWNLESGLVGISIFFVYQCAIPGLRQSSELAETFIKQSAFAFVAVTTATACVCSYYIWRFGEFPQIPIFLEMFQAFNAGYGAEPMPFLGGWIIHAAIYAISLFAGIQLISGNSTLQARRQGASLLAIAAAGLLWLRYYQGRSVPAQLMFATLPTVCCVGILVDILLSTTKNRTHQIISAGAVALSAAMLSAFILWAWSDPVPERRLANLSDVSAGNSEINKTVDRIISEFNAQKISQSDQLLVISPLAYLVQLKLGTPSPVNVTGMLQILFKSEILQISKLLEREDTRMLVVQDARVVATPQIAAILASSFDLLDPAACPIGWSGDLIFVRRAHRPSTLIVSTRGKPVPPRTSNPC